MTTDADWVEDVKRWYAASSAPGLRREGLVGDEADDLGYEAAQPALQARHWPDAAAVTTDQ